MSFSPPRIWHGGHRQTIAGVLLRRPPQLPWRRISLASAHGDTLSLDLLECSGPPMGRLLLLHGLTGNSQASPIPEIAARGSQMGIEVWALNFRGADGKISEIPRLYHAGCSDDLEAIFSQLPRDLPWALVGFSLGANVLLKWLGEHQQALPNTRALAVSCPFDLAQCCRNLEVSFLTRLYRRVLMRDLKSMATAFVAEHPAYRPSKPVHQWSAFYDIDQYLTAPLHGFDDAHDYWKRCSSSQFLASINTSTVILHAQDDPFQPAPPVGIRNQNIRWELTSTGGHLGFVGGLRTDWLVDRVTDFAISSENAGSQLSHRPTSR